MSSNSRSHVVSNPSPVSAAIPRNAPMFGATTISSSSSRPSAKYFSCS